MLNKVIAIGNVGADPEVRSFEGGGKVANFSLAVTDKWKDGDGQSREKTEWMRVSVQGGGRMDMGRRRISRGPAVRGS